MKSTKVGMIKPQGATDGMIIYLRFPAENTLFFVHTILYTTPCMLEYVGMFVSWDGIVSV